MRVHSSVTRRRRRAYEVLGLLVLIACVALLARPAAPPAPSAATPSGSLDGALWRRLSGDNVLKAINERELASLTARLEKNPGDLDLLYRRSLVHKAKGDTGAQLADLNRLIELEPAKSGSARALRADVLARQGRYHEALSDLETTTGTLLDTSATDVFILIGMGNHKEALPMLEATLFFGSSDVEALWSRARVYEELGRTEEAEADRERVAKLDPDYDLDWPTCVECHPEE